VKNHSPLGPLERWKHKAVGALLLVAFAPLLFVAFLRAVDEMAQVVVDFLGPFFPYVLVILVLAGIYRLAIKRYNR
jgi:hypothetical protein